MSRSQRSTSSRSARILLAALLAVGSGLHTGALAQMPTGATTAPPSGGPAWSTLTPAQQSALAPLKRDWQSIDAPRKQKWLEIAARFPAMPPEERQRVQERMNEWARMTPDERGRARLQFQEARQISPQDRQARWDAYLALPADERKALAKSAGTVPRTASPSPDQRQPNAAAASDRKNTVANVPVRQTAPESIAPVVIQAKPGASTTLVTKPATPPPHAQAGQPKIAATPDKVNRSTMLPQTGPQSAAPTAATAPGASASRGSR